MKIKIKELKVRFLETYTQQENIDSHGKVLQQNTFKIIDKVEKPIKDRPHYQKFNKHIIK